MRDLLMRDLLVRDVALIDQQGQPHGGGEDHKSDDQRDADGANVPGRYGVQFGSDADLAK